MARPSIPQLPLRIAELMSDIAWPEDGELVVMDRSRLAREMRELGYPITYQGLRKILVGDVGEPGALLRWTLLQAFQRHTPVELRMNYFFDRTAAVRLQRRLRAMREEIEMGATAGRAQVRRAAGTPQSRSTVVRRPGPRGPGTARSSGR